MDLRQIRHFVTVVRFGSFSLAAEHLRLTQPAISKSLKGLEQSLGVTLLERGPAGINVTLFGERLLAYAQLVLSLTEEAIDEIDALRGARRGSLNIGGMAAALRTVLPEAVLRFLKARPDVEVVMHEGLNDALLGQLFAGKLDIAVSVPPVDWLDNDYEWRPLRDEPVDFVASKSHPLASKESVTTADLAPYSWVVPPRPDPDRLKLDAHFIAAGLPKPTIAVATTSPTFLDVAVSRTDHLSYLTRSSIHAYGPDLVTLPYAGETWSRTICAVFRRRGVVRPIVLSFVRELEQVCHSPT